MSVPVKQSIQITFAGGLDKKTDDKQTIPSEFLALNNSVFTTGGRLSKRNGFPSLGKTINSPNPSLTYSNVGGTLTAARKIYSYNDELLLNDAFNLYSYDAASNSWNYKGRSTVVDLSTSSVIANSNTFTMCDCSVDTTTGIRVIAGWVGATGTLGTYYSIQDTATGQFIVNQAFLGANYAYPRCVSISGKSWILAINTSDHKLYYQAIVGQTVTGSPTALLTNVNATHPYYDIDVDPNTGNLYVVWNTTTPSISIAALSTSLVVGNTITKVETCAANLSFFGDGTNIWVVYNTGAATKGFIVNNAISATTIAPFIIDSSALAANVNSVTGTWSSTNSLAFVFYDPLTLTGSQTTTAAINYNTVALSGGVATAGTAGLFIGSLSINSKAFSVSGIPHVVGLYSYNGGLQATNFLLNLYNLTPSMGSSANNDVVANIAGKISPDEALTTAPIGGITQQAGTLAGIHQTATNVWECALLQSTNYTTANSNFITPFGVIDCKFDFSLSNPDVQVLGNNSNSAGASVLMYDGASVVEQNFHIYPNPPTYVIATTGGGMGLSGADTIYSYIITYEWIDNQGQVHRSFPSPVLTPLAVGHSYTFAGGVTAGKITLTIPTLRVTNKSGSQVVMGIYRTTANGSVYYRVNALFKDASGDNTNDPSTNSVTFIDTFSDAQILGNVQLYTNGALGYYAPPATKALTNFKNRAIAVASEDQYQINYSNAVLQNFPVQFVPFFLQNIGTVGGALITVAQMDDKMILFKSGKISGPAIYYMVGTGPAPSGANNDFTDPLPIAVDVGAVDRPSVVITPIGLMFKSDKGIYLLSRALEAIYIGAPVESYNQYSVLTAQLIPNTTQVRFMLSNGVLLMYDYFYKKWSTWTNPAGISDCIFQGQHTYVASDGTVYKEAPGTYYDGTSTPVLMSFTTAWIKLAGLQGYQRAYFFYLLAEYISAHQLQLQIYYDFSSTPNQTTTITPNASNSLENWRVFLSKQRCQAFQIALTEIYTGTLGEGFNMSGLNLIAGIKGPFRTISAAQSAG